MPIELGLHGRSAPSVGLRRRNTPSRSAQADRWPKAPGGRIHSARPAPGISLRRHKRRLTDRRRLSCRLKSASTGAPRQASASADANPLPGQRRPTVGRRSSRPNSFGTPRARRRPPPTQRALFRSAQADRRPKAPQGRIHSTGRPTVGRRPLEAEFIRRPRPTLSGRPPQAEFIRRI